MYIYLFCCSEGRTRCREVANFEDSESDLPDFEKLAQNFGKGWQKAIDYRDTYKKYKLERLVRDT